MNEKTVVEYIIVHNALDNEPMLTGQINSKIKEGFQPFGAPAVTDHKIIVQAMVKYSVKKPSYYWVKKPSK